jgi:glyoxylase-like metal-dependent hydrolase (beta-lactamase superfamily II)
MEIKIFYFNPLRECSYLLWDDSCECVIVDPGCYGERECQRVTDFVKEKGLKPVKILLTHGHFDHVLGLEQLAQEWKVDAWMHPGDKGLLEGSGEWCRQLGLEYHPFTGVMHDLSDGDTVTFGHTVLQVIATPGHTEGGVCFYCKEDAVLLTGDTLFAGSIGRTDHIGGNYDKLMESITTRIMPLDGNISILPGHGPASSVGYERSTNPFLQNA